MMTENATDAASNKQQTGLALRILGFTTFIPVLAYFLDLLLLGGDGFDYYDEDLFVPLALVGFAGAFLLAMGYALKTAAGRGRNGRS